MLQHDLRVAPELELTQLSSKVSLIVCRFLNLNDIFPNHGAV